VNADANVPEPELIEIEKHYRRHTRLTTNKLPDDLPVEIVEHDLSEDKRVCPSCGGKLYVMGRDSRRELVIIPAQVKSGSMYGKSTLAVIANGMMTARPS
jgi:transposase